MERENKNEAIASGHRARILQAAEALFMEKSFPATTIADISAASGYSRRTLYAYYESKEEILRQIVKQGLEQLRQELQSAVESSESLERRSRAVLMPCFGITGNRPVRRRWWLPRRPGS